MDAVRHWYRSLYWRVALGLFAFLTLMLAAEGALFLWMNDRIAASMPARSPRMLALLVASDLASALTANPQLDLEAHIRVQYGSVLQPFVVIMRDGRVIANQDDLPEALVAVARLERPGPRGFGGRGRGAPPPDGEAEAPFPGRGGPGPRQQRLRSELAPIVVDETLVGRVAVWTGRPPLARILRQLGPTLVVLAGSVLIVGTTLIAFFVFGPTRRRLKDVEDATTRLGAGDSTARAPEHGGDEVAALGRSFNRMADELARRSRALDASDQARRQLLADVSHELMTPLTAMRGYVETLAMSEPQFDAPTRERYLRIALDETHRLEHIIGDLLDLARLEGGGGTMRREHVGIATLFARVAARHERELRERGVTLVQRVDPGAETVPADPDRFEQALQNLAANALRHTPDGGQISLTASAVRDAVSITVRDTGPGIAPEHLPLIFDRFYKTDASRKAAGGSGLGLSIVKAIVERHGGSITARNDGGATFEIVLPRVLEAGQGRTA
jgi:signal transduction histidine kinase